MRGPFAMEFYQCVTYGAYTAEWQEQVLCVIKYFFCQIKDKYEKLAPTIVFSRSVVNSTVF